MKFQILVIYFALFLNCNIIQVQANNVPYLPVSENWIFKANNAIRSTPVYNDGTLYFGSADHFLYALHSNGKLKWKLDVLSGVSCQPFIKDGVVYLITQNNNCMAINESGKILWQKQLGKTVAYEWGFDYYTSSPIFVKNKLLVGSGDGNFYCLDKKGNILWKYECGVRVHAPAESDGENVYFGDMNGLVYKLDLTTGKPKWIFKTEGFSLKNDEFGFDRKAIIAQPVITGNRVIVGSRDGFLYSIDASKGILQWKFDYAVSWVMSRVAVYGDKVISTTSDGHFVHALNITDGKEIWRFKTGSSPVWAAPAVSGTNIIAAATNGIVYSINAKSGLENWRYTAGCDKIFSFPLCVNGNIYFGNDAGQFISIKESTIARPLVHRAVYWNANPPVRFHKFGTDAFLKDYFSDNGYFVMNDSSLQIFLQDRIRDSLPSVMVFATNYIPVKLFGDHAHSNLILSYLKKGGKIVVTGITPGIYGFDSTGIYQDFALLKDRFEIPYPYNDTRAYNGFYPSSVTDDGRKWGISTVPVSSGGIYPKLVTTVFALDESGKASSWVKNYGGKEGTGLVQLRISLPDMRCAKEILFAAEYGF